MNWIKVILWLAQNLPAIIKGVVEIVRAIKEIRDPVEKAHAELNLKTAVEKAKRERDISGIGAVRDMPSVKEKIEEQRKRRQAMRSGRT